MTTTTTRSLAAIAAAGLGRKRSTMVETHFGTTTSAATDGDVWTAVVVDAAADAVDGTEGSIVPPPERSGETAAATIGGRDLRRIVAGIVPATDTETSRYALGGTLVEVAEGSLLVAVGTDGRRLHAGHIQPSAISGQAAVIVPAAQWRSIDAAIRAVCRQLLGAAGRRVDAVIDRGTVRIEVGVHAPSNGSTVCITWTSSEADGHGRATLVRSIAVAVAGRFPRWRECVPAGGEELTIDAPAVAAEAARFAAIHRKAAAAARKAQRQPSGPSYHHPRGVACGRAGMVGCGAEWTSAVPATPVAVLLDPRYLADATAAAAAWGAPVVARGTDDISAVTFTAGEEFGPRFVAVIMPLARD